MDVRKCCLGRNAKYPVYIAKRFIFFRSSVHACNSRPSKHSNARNVSNDALFPIENERRYSSSSFFQSADTVSDAHVTSAAAATIKTQDGPSGQQFFPQVSETLFKEQLFKEHESRTVRDSRRRILSPATSLV